MTCTLCLDHIKKEAPFIDENENCFYVELPHEVIENWAMILPKRCVETVFDLNEHEIQDTFKLLNKYKTNIQEKLNPDGFNVGWNCYETGGQSTMHAHLHLIPRFNDEPFAGKGLRHWFKLKENMRPSRKN
jgi:diadenosine tetraphosphate (Ap4A) HIT family hydrolase